MCLALYVGLNKPLEPINKISGKAGFYIEAVKDDANYIFQNITKRFVYFIGSAKGCSCGFLMDGVYPDTDLEEWLDISETYDQLVNYFENVAKDEELQFYYCRMGEESKKPEVFRQIEFSEMKRTDFDFEVNHFYNVKIYS